MADESQDSRKCRSPSVFEPKSVQEWETWLRNDTWGGFLIRRDLFRSDAFRELRESPKCLMVFLEAWSQLNYEKKNQSDRRGKRSLVYKNGGTIYLTQNRLRAAGIKSSATQAAAKKLLVKLGFLDVVETGCLFQATVFRVSDRWRQFPWPPPLEGSKPIARRMYAECSLSDPDHPIHQKRRKAKSHSTNECSQHSTDECSASSSHSKNECKEGANTGQAAFKN
jgi:hypothetical protein